MPEQQPIQLPDFLITTLYKDSLVIIDGEQKSGETVQVQTQTAPERQWYLGSNLQKITMVVNQKDAVYLHDEALQFLSSILGACKLNLGDVAIVNYNNEPITYAFLKQHTMPQNLVLFGVTAQQVQLSFTVPNYQVQKYDNCNFLLAAPLESMLGNGQEAKLEKSKLWLSLKKMFNI